MYTQHPLANTTNIRTENEITTELSDLCKQYSHPQYPLLRAGYSPASRYLAVDFTPWIISKLTKRGFDEIAYFLTQLTSANTGLGVSSDYWTRQALDLCNFNLSEVIQSNDQQAFLDLHAALFPYILHGTLDGFMLLDSHVDFLARTMSPYAFSIHHLESKVNATNKFIKQMRKETKKTSTAWTDYPLLNAKDLREFQNLTPPTPGLRAKLREVSIGARQLFFGTLLEGPGNGHWSARPYGIDEEKASLELAKAELGELQNDPVLVLTTYRKEELLEPLKGHPIKQGWNKKYIAKYIAENAPDILTRLTEGKQVFVLQTDIRDQRTLLADWASKIKVLLAIALGFKEE